MVLHREGTKDHMSGSCTIMYSWCIHILKLCEPITALTDCVFLVDHLWMDCVDSIQVCGHCQTVQHELIGTENFPICVCGCAWMETQLYSFHGVMAHVYIIFGTENEKEQTCSLASDDLVKCSHLCIQDTGTSVMFVWGGGGGCIIWGKHPVCHSW